MEYAQALGSAFRSLRLQLNLTQQDFLPTTSISTISRIERGEMNPTLPVIEKLAKVMGVDPLVILVLAAARRDGSEEGKAVIARIEGHLRMLGRFE
ncbi:helix-turn-helix transcriptional regulator [Pseudomonas sp. SbB1]|uniref:Transcriptional regulator, XRE family n=1 Tax=Pseudomonas putida (strain GB-1) TaxID=76869 RepID=B0KSX4_PSEPG|nr:MULTISPECIES: helix-turn-helix transcriptional regulator [Pseudomonas]ABZ00061.1 transcriptional regulator, XRE family [Pseudomonas putida GB-1]EKT4564059.1 helix-turn-helix transcriptional regulator [Pseudomonas putida]ELF6208687.1 helix-turn-helix transcriptional regulator [Pseudomonas putida]MBP0707856.1 helix-turn-helix transcriptional regulator [Pseudomonas sp. T34]MCK2187297.1 helix-turn-helix domain-containing protein [Pseudomonas sp. MB04B]